MRSHGWWRSTKFVRSSGRIENRHGIGIDGNYEESTRSQSLGDEQVLDTGIQEEQGERTTAYNDSQ